MQCYVTFRWSGLEVTSVCFMAEGVPKEECHASEGTLVASTAGWTALGFDWVLSISLLGSRIIHRSKT